MPYVTVHGTRLFYRILGSGDPLLLLHGGPGTDHTWFLPGMEALVSSFSLIMYDHAGHGRSDEVDSDTLTLERLVDDVEGLRTALRLGPVHMLGHSFGGFLALLYALRYPQGLRRLVLVSTAPSNRFLSEAEANALRSATPTMLEALHRLWNAKDLSDEQFRRDFETILPLYYHDRKHCPSNLHDMVFRFRARKVLIEREIPRYDVEDRLGEIRVPVLVTVGRDDWITPVSQSERLARGIPGARLVVFDRSGHSPFNEETEAFADCVRTFLQE